MGIHILLILMVLFVTESLLLIQYSQTTFATFLIPTSKAIIDIPMSDKARRTDNFSANGAISSLTYVTETPKNLSSTSIKIDSSADLTKARKYILFGDWNLEVKSGKVTKFGANFVQVLDDGGLSHPHNLINFVQANDTTITLTPDLWTSINGTVDVKYNGTTTWSAVEAEILIFEGRTIEISLDNNATNNHFQGQPIHGVVKSIKSLFLSQWCHKYIDLCYRNS